MVSVKKHSQGLVNKSQKRLEFSMLLAMEGNDSLKRILQKDKTFDEEGNATRGQSQQPDPRTAGAGGTYWLDRDKVYRWAKEVIEGMTQRYRILKINTKNQAQENLGEEQIFVLKTSIMALSQNGLSQSVTWGSHETDEKNAIDVKN
ncbi:hypothetical protein B0H13DRAFT_1857135 [Mycena leptocephala]|nr:hypothetical protein B0H13DRAFT_1857135 [Mycena leptocephala]